MRPETARVLKPGPNIQGVGRWLLFAGLIQALYFVASVVSVTPHYLYSDNRFYETPAWNLAQGRGFTIARTEWEDPYLTRAYAGRHPGADLSHVPAVVFPPGYGFFLAAIYSLVGSRSHFAAVIANGLLMAVALAGLMILARKTLHGSGQQRLFLALCALFPFWAFWAARMVTDTLHIALMTWAVVLWTTGDVSWRRSLGVGVLMGLATLTRPYTLGLPAAFGIGWAIKGRGRGALLDAACVTLVSGLIMGVWVARNHYYFGEPLVVSLTKGQGLWQATHYEADKGLFGNFDPAEVAAGLRATGIVDAYRYEDNRRLRDLGLEKIKKAPFRFALRTLGLIPRLWIPTGSIFSTFTKSLLIAWFALLFLALLYGLSRVIGSNDPVLEASSIVVLYYTFIFLFPGHVESRYVLPARGFSFLLIAAALSTAWTASVRARLPRRWPPRRRLLTT